MNICVIIPANNEAQNIARIVGELRQKGFDAVVIDDGSTDGTGGIAHASGAFLIRLEQKNGKGFSLRQGFAFALKHNYDGVIMMDGDGQHAVTDMDRFLEVFRQHKVSIVVGNRMTEAKGMPFIRYCTNRFMSWLISLACRQKIPDTQCGYRYVSCDILRKIKLESNDFEIETEILMKTARQGFKIYSVPVKTIYRDEESKINPVKDTIRFIAYFLKEVFSSRP